MKTFVAWIQSVALSLGGPGLFLIAFLDSSFVSLPQVNDLLIVWMVTKHPERMPLYAAMATLGSVAGCFVMYYLGRKGGEALLKRRFNTRTVERGMNLFQRYGVLAIVVPALLPPPAPFKIFVLLAGVARMPPLKFGIAVAVGRGARYLAEGVLAMWYGERALAFIGAHGREVSLAVGLTVLVLGVLYVLWRRRRPGGAAPAEPDPAGRL